MTACIVKERLMTSTLPFSQASENNKEPILAVLRAWLARSHAVLELGSGSGQHAVHFAPALPHLIWHTSDLQPAHAGIMAWLSRYPSSNLRAPQLLDLRCAGWQVRAQPIGVDAVYSANTAHIMHWEAVCSMFSGVGELLPIGGLFLLYGPFNDAGEYTSEGNRAFDASLRARDAGMGIRDWQAIDTLAVHAGLQLLKDEAMPANNRLLIWCRR
jgi:cyclopropane fatty-acyl-phospholipid synthase-like methyltransferase